MKKNKFNLNIATVNGSGSQSANQILLKSLFRMGVPVGGKNVFPSNISGMPTWFWIRANPHGFVGSKKYADIVFALNPQTVKEDIQTLVPQGFFFYSSEFSIEESARRNDINMIAVPFKKLADLATDVTKIKKFIVNVIYVGILAELLKIDKDLVKKVIEDQLGSKGSALPSNLKAFEVGCQYARENLEDLKFPYQVESKVAPVNKVIMDGNTAGALGLVAGGCSFVSWYPITPSTSMMDSFGKFCSQMRKDETGHNKYAIVQAEDELSAFCMVLGAGWAGARAMTATSGPGMSLMAEAAGYSYFTEIPTVIWNVQRVGPSTGLPTRTLQGDLLFAANLSHGDKKHPILIPGGIEECFEFGQTCFDLSERLQQLVIVLSDLDIGMNLWIADEFKMSSKPYDRGKVLTKEDLDRLGTFERYRDVDGDGIAYRTIPGTEHPKAAYFTRGSGHNAKALYTEKANEHEENMLRLEKKWETAKKLVPKPEIHLSKTVKGTGNTVGVIYYGSTQAVIQEVVYELANKGVAIDLCRIRAYPFCEEISDFVKKHETLYVVDQNRDAQMKQLLVQEYSLEAKKMKSIRHFDGTPITADVILTSFLNLQQ